MRFGICFNLDYHPEVHGTPRDYYWQILEYCDLLEEYGFDSAWFSEHHSGPYSFGNPALILAAAAVRTKRLKLGTGVSLLPLHHPITLSEEYAMLDQLSGGRLEYGVGRGYLMHEYDWLGADGAQSTPRYRESVDCIQKIWASNAKKMSYKGEFFDFKDYTPFPEVAQKPLPPIYSSAQSSESYAFAGSKGCNIGISLFVPGAIEALPVGVAAYKDALKEAGVAREDREIMGITQMFCGANDAEAITTGAQSAKNYFNFFSQIIIEATGPTFVSETMTKVDPVALNTANQTLFGSPESLIKKITKMHEAWDVDYFQLEVAQGGLEPAKVREALRLFGQEVIPHFKKEKARKPDLVS